MQKSILKEIIASNEEFILKQVKGPVQREGITFPGKLNKVVVFYGVRRSGKTFILFDLFQKNKERSLYIDFEDERLTGFQADDFEKLREAFLELKPHLIGKETLFLLDEIQNVEGWERFCRRAVERENIKVFVSGSSSKMMPFEIHTELRGRSWSIEVLPFSFTEYMRVKGLDVKEETAFSSTKKAFARKYFNDYVRWGGFPEVSFLDTELERTRLLKEYLGAMFFRDLVERYSITNIPLLEALLDKLFSSFSLRFSLTAFYKQYKNKFPFSKDLLFRYYKNFLDSMLIFEVRKFAESTYKRMRNPANIYLVDNGLGKRVSSADSGRLLENLAFLELKRKRYEVFYFAEKRECDFIAKSEDNRLLPVQVCFEMTEENMDREIAGLIEACHWVGVNEGIILTHDEEKELSIDGISIKVYPLWKWCMA
ncbi:MAG: ATP-binding protein [Thermodesulfobacteriota bacterium]